MELLNIKPEVGLNGSILVHKVYGLLESGYKVITKAYDKGKSLWAYVELDGVVLNIQQLGDEFSIYLPSRFKDSGVKAKAILLASGDDALTFDFDNIKANYPALEPEFKTLLQIIEYTIDLDVKYYNISLGLNKKDND